MHFTSRSLKVISLEQISENGAWIGLGAGTTFVIMASVFLCIYLVLRLRTSQYKEGWANSKEDECHARSDARDTSANEPSTNPLHEPIRADLHSRLLEGDTPKGSPKLPMGRGASFATSPKRNGSFFSSPVISGLSREGVASLMLRAAELLKDPHSPSYGRIDGKTLGRSPLGMPTREQPLEEITTTSANRESFQRFNNTIQEQNCRIDMCPRSGSCPTNASKTSGVQISKAGGHEELLNSAPIVSDSEIEMGLADVPYQPMCCQHIDTSSTAREDDRRPLLSAPSSASRYAADSWMGRDTKGNVVTLKEKMNAWKDTDSGSKGEKTDILPYTQETDSERPMQGTEQSRSRDTVEEVKVVVEALIDQTLGSVGDCSRSWTTQEDSCMNLKKGSKQQSRETWHQGSPNRSYQSLEESVMSGCGGVTHSARTYEEEDVNTMRESRSSPLNETSRDEPPGGSGTLNTEAGDNVVSRANSTFNNPFYDKSLTRSPSPKLQDSVKPLTPTTPADQRCMPLNPTSKCTNDQPSDGEGWEDVMLPESHLLEMPKTIEV